MTKERTQNSDGPNVADRLVPTAEQGVEAPLRFCDYCKSWHSKPCGNGCVWQPDMPTELPEPTPRTCTCHRDDSPPVPCAENYAFSECSALTPPIAGTGEEVAKQTDGDVQKEMHRIRHAYLTTDGDSEDALTYAKHVVSMRRSISRLYSRIGELERERDEALTSLSQALNEGDGVYRP